MSQEKAVSHNSSNIVCRGCQKWERASLKNTVLLLVAYLDSMGCCRDRSRSNTALPWRKIAGGSHDSVYVATSKTEQAPVSSSVCTVNKTQRSLTKAVKSPETQLSSIGRPEEKRRVRGGVSLTSAARFAGALEAWRGAARWGGAPGPGRKWLCGCRSGRAALSSPPADKPVSGERSLAAGGDG